MARSWYIPLGRRGLGRSRPAPSYRSPGQCHPGGEDVSVLAKATGTVALKIRPLASASYGPAHTARSASPATAQATVRCRSSRHARPVGTRTSRPRLVAGAKLDLGGGGRNGGPTGLGGYCGATMQSRFDELDQSCGSASGPNYPGCSASAIQGVKGRELATNVLWAVSGGGAVATERSSSSRGEE